MYERVLSNQLGHDMLGGFQSNIYSSQKTIHLLLHNVSVNFKPDHPPVDPRDSHILVAPRVGFFSSLSCPKVCPGDLKSKEKFDNFEKSRFLLRH